MQLIIGAIRLVIFIEHQIGAVILGAPILDQAILLNQHSVEQSLSQRY